jgi:hypothetical protein
MRGPGAILLALGLFFSGMASAAPRPVHVVGSVAEMQSADGAKTPVLQVLGYHAGSLLGGGLFAWQASGKAPDNCTIFTGADGNGRWVRRLETGVLDVTMCGARWDGTTDDGPAFNAAFTVASANGYSLSCPGGLGRIARTVAPQRFEKVILRCQGMEASRIYCDLAGKPCFLFQNPVLLREVQAPQIYDLSIETRRPRGGAGVMIQYNSIAGGFTDDATSQSYMMRPMVQRVQIVGGDIGIQCSKCFDGDFSFNHFTVQRKHGVDLEGSDWMSVARNRIAATGGPPVRLASHGTFANGNAVTHNDLLSPDKGVEAYILSSARTSYIEKNYMEGATRGACEIKIDMGAAHAVVRDNHVTDRTVKNWLCVVPQLRQADFSYNQTTSHGQGAARFDHQGNWKDLIFRHVITHRGNWSEAGFPSAWRLFGFF